jgi:CDP-diacylglycerol--glycerol-3-phosphate 3-phosphatidyltransferase
MIDNERSPKQVMVVAELAKQYSTRGACEAVASIYDLKPRFQALLRPITNSLAAKGVTANQVTIAAAIVSLATGAIVAARPESRPILLLVPLVLFVRMALNAIDGMLAREHNMKSRRGAVLNELGDVVSDAGIYLPMALVPGMPAALLVVLGIISEMAGVVAVQIGAERRYDGPLGKSDRAFAFGLIAFLLGCGVPEGKWLTWLFAILIVMASVTIIRRGRRARILADESATN